MLRCEGFDHGNTLESLLVGHLLHSKIFLRIGATRKYITLSLPRVTNCMCRPSDCLRNCGFMSVTTETGAGRVLNIVENREPLSLA